MPSDTNNQNTSTAQDQPQGNDQPLPNQTPYSVENVAEEASPRITEDPVEKAKLLLNENGKNKRVFFKTSDGQKSGGGKLIATILGIFLLVGAVAAGVLLVQQNQNVQEKAAGSGSWTGTDGTCSWTCTGTSCTITGGTSPNCFINHYFCPENLGGEPCNDNPENQLQNTSFQYSCGAEQIDVNCGPGAQGGQCQASGGQYAETIARAGSQTCQIGCKICAGPNDCDNENEPMCLGQYNECEDDGDCGGPTPTPTPTPPPNNVNPTCSSFTISDTTIDIGDIITITAAGSDPDGTVTHIDFYWAKVGVDYCANNGANWTLIEDVDTNPATTTWDTSELTGVIGADDSVYVSANVHDNVGGWCTGNPAGVCGLPISACPNCGGTISINSAPPTSTPTPTPTPTATPTPPPPGDTIGGICLEIKAYVVTGPVDLATSWARVTVSDLENVKPGDSVYFTVAGLLTSSTGGSTALVDMARFGVTEDSSQVPTWIVSTDIKPLPVNLAGPQGPDEYYYQYVIPEIQKMFAVHAQVHDPRNNNWF